MSMHVDFQYPRQVEDVENVKAAVRSFDKEMRKMMLLMKEVGNTLEGVSVSFSALTCLNMQHDKDIRQYIDSFREQIVKMKEGAPYQDYNRLVHEEVLGPVSQLKVSIKEAEISRAKRDTSYKRYKKVKAKVDKTERSYAQKSKPLEESKSYPKDKTARERHLTEFRENDSAFQETFADFIKKVEAVTQSAMHRYLELNAGYLTSVVDALTSTDPSIEEHVALYRRQLYADRTCEIAQRKKEVEESLSNQPASASISGTGFDYNSHSCRQGPAAAASASGSAAVAVVGSSVKKKKNSAVHCSAALEDSVVKTREAMQSAQGVKPAAGGPPAAAEEPIKSDYYPKTERKVGIHVVENRQKQQQQQQQQEEKEKEKEEREKEKEIKKKEEEAAAAAAEVERRMNEVASSIPVEKELGLSVFEEEGDGGESYFGSVSQVNEMHQHQIQQLQKIQQLQQFQPLSQQKQQTAENSTKTTASASELSPTVMKPLYRFAPSTVAGASSTAGGGYMAAQDNAINETFLAGLEKEKDL